MCAQLLNGDPFIGICVGLRNGYAAVQVAGYAEFPYEVDFVPLLEAETDRLSPPNAAPFAFCVPDGFVHLARAVCRRAERSLVRFSPGHPGIPFLNRLSAYLFALACIISSAS